MAKTPMRIAFPSEQFHAMLPPFQAAGAVDGKVKAFIVDKFYDVGEYLTRAGYEFIDQARKASPETHFVFDFHVGEPALLGSTFLYNWRTRGFQAWLWTEQPEQVTAMSVEQVKQELAASQAKLY